jgi:amino acid adenylation domain-containing protein
MTTVEQVWEEAGRRGVELKLDGEQLRVRADRGALTPEFADALRRYKPELIERLRKLVPGQRATPLVRVPRGADVPLSFAQEQLWLVDQIESEGAAYNVAAALRFEGPINEELLERALGSVVARHDALRTHFVEADGHVAQRVLASAPPVLSRSDLTTLPAGVRIEQLQLQLREDTRQRFELRAAPPIRWRLSSLGERDHVLSVVLHHIIADAWSVRVMFSELTTAYFAHLVDEVWPAELPLQYVDYAAWQRQSFTASPVRNDLDFWREELEGTPALLPLPADRAREAGHGGLAGRVAFELDAELSAAVRRLAKDTQTTPFSILLGVYALLLARLSGEDDVVIGAPTITRDDDRLEGVLGYFVNTLAFRVKPADADSYSKLFERTRATLLRGMRHQVVPFQQVVQELNPPRSSAHNPIYQVLFTYLPNLSSLNVVRDGLKVSMFDVESAMTRFDLNLMVEERGDVLRCVFEYDRQLFDAATVERWARQYRGALSACASDASADPWREPLTQTAEERAVLSSAEQAVRLGAVKDVLGWFAQNARKFSTRPAVRCGNEALDYATLARRSDELAQVLLDSGAQPGDGIGVCSSRGIASVVALLATMKAGAAYVPLDPSYPEARLRAMQEAAGLRLVIVDPSLAAIGAALGVRTVPADAQPRGAARPLQTDPAAASTAYVLFTSGSEGQPKGVAMPHLALANLMAWQLRTTPVEPGEVVAQFAPTTFDVSIQEVFAALCSGAELAVFNEEERWNSRETLAALQRYGVTRLHLPFVALQQLATTAAHHPVHLPALRHVISAGEALRITPALRAFFSAQPGCRLHNQYGPTETHVITEYVLPSDVQHWPALPPIGKPIDNTTILLLDRHRRPVPIGVAGEIFAVGACVASGYLGPVQAADGFVVLDDGRRAYRTGDLARYDTNGDLIFLRRRDSQAKIRGYRIELLEVERAISGLPGVNDAAVVVHTSEAGEARLVAYVTLDSTRSDTQGLRTDASRVLPDYMIPSAFFSLPELPRTASNKVARSKLPRPDLDPSAWAGEGAAATTVWQQRLATLWSELLEMKSVPIDANFFDLGGHSLLATRLADRLGEELGMDVPVRVVFDVPTIRGQEAWILSRCSDADASIETGEA